MTSSHPQSDTWPLASSKYENEFLLPIWFMNTEQAVAHMTTISETGETKFSDQITNAGLLEQMKENTRNPGVTILFLEVKGGSEARAIYSSTARKIFSYYDAPPRVWADFGDCDSGFHYFFEPPCPGTLTVDGKANPGGFHGWMNLGVDISPETSTLIENLSSSSMDPSHNKLASNLTTHIYSYFDPINSHTIIVLTGHFSLYKNFRQTYSKRPGCVNPLLSFTRLIQTVCDILTIGIRMDFLRPQEVISGAYNDPIRTLRGSIARTSAGLYVAETAGYVVRVANALSVLEKEFTEHYQSNTMSAFSIQQVIHHVQAQAREVQHGINEAHLTANQRGVELILGLAALQEAKLMKIITIVTLTFLPPTFVATLFGMSVFSFGSEDSQSTERLTVSGDWWKVVLVAVVLSALTMGATILYLRWTHKRESRELPDTRWSSARSLVWGPYARYLHKEQMTLQSQKEVV